MDTIITEKDKRIQEQINRIRALEKEVLDLKEETKAIEILKQTIFEKDSIIEGYRSKFLTFNRLNRESSNSMPALFTIECDQHRHDNVVQAGPVTAFNVKDHHDDQQERRQITSWTPNVQRNQSGQPFDVTDAYHSHESRSNSSTLNPADHSDALAPVTGMVRDGHHRQSGSITSAMTPSPRDQQERERDFSPPSRHGNRNEHEEEGGHPLPPRLSIRRVADDEQMRGMAHVQMPVLGMIPGQLNGSHELVDREESGNEDIDFPEDDDDEVLEVGRPPAQKSRRRLRSSVENHNSHGNKRKSPTKKRRGRPPGSNKKSKPSTSYSADMDESSVPSNEYRNYTRGPRLSRCVAQ